MKGFPITRELKEIARNLLGISSVYITFSNESVPYRTKN